MRALRSTHAAYRSRWQRHWDRMAPAYDHRMGVLERALFADTREWIGSRASGRVLEVGVGTGLNLAHYPPDAAVTGIDISPAMLAIARKRAADLGRDVELRTGSAEALDFDIAGLNTGRFDTVVCTFSLCAVPDHRRAVAEMARVLRPGGWLLLADHVVATNPAVRAAQCVVEWFSVPLHGEHFRRRPYELVVAAGLEVRERDRFALGALERLAARKPRPEAGAR
ncbi:class I SAM-dependent methyltransferase [Pseudonocardia acaciae]|uniref:class I SAM-dependent methyltransferase n=1 Tax=Pseudonocardia acaciae TaxID=551276 RepID=UPI000B07AC22